MQTLSFPYRLIPAVAVGLLAACGATEQTEPADRAPPESAQLHGHPAFAENPKRAARRRKRGCGPQVQLGERTYLPQLSPNDCNVLTLIRSPASLRIKNPLASTLWPIKFCGSK